MHKEEGGLGLYTYICKVVYLLESWFGYTLSQNFKADLAHAP